MAMRRSGQAADQYGSGGAGMDRFHASAAG
jgi:hypothetical protein